MDSKSITDSYNHAVVIGGSIAGLMTAKVLSETFESVTVLERDSLPEGPEIRQGAPQGGHIHVILESGRILLEKFYPGLFAELEASGANIIDTANQVSWFHHGVWKMRYKSNIMMALVTRVFLEWNIRKRTARVPNINIMTETAVSDLISSPDNKTILGVKLHKAGDSTNVSELMADLVVDASGRGSRTPAWLKDMGYEPPEEEHIGINLSYTTRMYEKPAGFKEDWKFLIHYPKTPDTWRAGFIACVEDNKWIVSLNGYFKDGAAPDEAGFMEYAAGLAQPHLYNYIKNARPTSDFRVHKVPSSRWRHYEKLSRFPENLITLGDSVTSFNPIFGQGMATAAKAVQLLGQQIQEQARKTPGSLKGLSNRFRKTLPTKLKVPWLLSTILDLNYPQATGQKPPAHGFLAWYVGKLLEASSVDKVIFSQFNDVLHMKRGLWVVLKPSVSLRVLMYGFKSLYTPLNKWANTSRPAYEHNDIEVPVKQTSVSN